MKSFCSNVGASVLSAFVIAGLLGAYNDYSLKNCNLAGCWEMRLTYENTTKKSFEGMNVNYDLILSQSGSHIIGHGEKSSDDRDEIAREVKSVLSIDGGIIYKVFSPNKISLFYLEENPNGNTILKSSTVLGLERTNNDTFEGIFRSTIANTQGKAILVRKKPGST